LANDTSDSKKLKNLRKLIFQTGYRGGLAHLASSYSALDIIYVLYLKGIMRFDPQNAKWDNRDRFVLSKGHAGLALYAVLFEAGLISRECLESYLSENSQIGGEPCMRDCEWVEATTGSLGHGLPMAVGMALGLKVDESPAKVYCMIGDGELQEGTMWEAIMSAVAFGLDNLTVVLDCNMIQKMDTVANTMGINGWIDRISAFGWNVIEIDGHDIEEIKEALLCRYANGMPTFIVANTIKGKGISIMENNPNWHFKLPNRKELKIFIEELDIEERELE